MKDSSNDRTKRQSAFPPQSNHRNQRSGSCSICCTHIDHAFRCTCLELGFQPSFKIQPCLEIQPGFARQPGIACQPSFEPQRFVGFVKLVFAKLSVVAVFVQRT
ncbi:hypothetical protein [Aliiroseovarius sp. F20344]|uniref:hypothetical protein n=1 Tax=Aliiroseovarius sp. F20344 TaxID=2926414 RepID=UPI001FF562F8|nr:hypothetical protein [Aliiroseovarius sp. F20344]MCK0142251.1 hypothetical protein [Aliiroseovarius sp. F20344]